MKYLRRKWCEWFGHKYVAQVCGRCGRRAISRAEVLALLLPGLNELFGMKYKKYEDKEDK